MGGGRGGQRRYGRVPQVYGLLLAVPLMAWLLTKFVPGAAPDTVQWRQLACVYGYSLTIFLPVSILALIPNEVRGPREGKSGN